MRELLAAAAIAALLGSDARASEKSADASAPASVTETKASDPKKKERLPRKKGPSLRKAGAGSAGEKKLEARKPDGAADGETADATESRKNPDPCQPVKPCPID